MVARIRGGGTGQLSQWRSVKGTAVRFKPRKREDPENWNVSQLVVVM